MYKEDVLNYYGTLVKLAEVLKISPSAISQWKEIIPEKQAYKLQRISNNALIVNPELYKC
ncbi:Cro/CI family transcriptional regulator [Kingella negevensis]|uniref:Cro/CI family transcriptional regulator n=1 Tax=Kingella negevensis TaxID=1522312 RepID=UPI002551A505|nr:Cro/CI family transcriptional regulator [Kingella negevensis]MDK4684351.1 Cro/CI family transcriptional regulator [Kingella negevensis]MDK4696362.1 Cro/CI family transcriptional regulator [Kingella negevensis]MDK4707620.1 Cro/CI family transcriptional regulator [Kingella negevensis]MDK4709533.1 Cro/CI family transcriptional regulator [Kingella negevensis]